MGGILSGNNSRTHGTTTETLQIDSYQIGRCIIDGEKSFRLAWSVGSVIRVNVVGEAEIELSYSVTDTHTGERSVIKQRYQLHWYNGKYGGKYARFLCGACGQKAALLYLSGKHFKCRQCANLNYPIQQSDGLNKLRIKFYKCAAALKLGDVPFEKLLRIKPNKPKGMHNKTYFPLLAKFYDARSEYNDFWAKGALKEFPQIKGIDTS